MSAQLKFFTFRQNNSGGSFDHDPALGISINVFVQAVDAKHAEARAELIGLYFNGCANGMDCSCCGDRWSELWGDYAEGSDEPMQYGDVWAPVQDGESPTLEPFFGEPSYIHYFDGTFKAAKKVTP